MMAQICPDETERFRRALHRLAELGVNPFYPRASIGELAHAERLTPEHLTAYFERENARWALISCLRRIELPE